MVLYSITQHLHYMAWLITRSGTHSSVDVAPGYFRTFVGGRTLVLCLVFVD